MHPQNITDARHVVSQSSRQPTHSDVIFHQPFSRHKFCDFAQVLSLSHHWKLYVTTDLLSSAISGDKIQPAAGLDTTLRLYPSQNSLLQTVLDETLQPVLWLNLAVTCYFFVRSLQFFTFSMNLFVLHIVIILKEFSNLMQSICINFIIYAGGI